MATPPDFTAGAVLTAAQMDKIGMWLITKNTFASVTSVTINNCFTSDYKNYKIIFNPDACAGTAYVTIQFTISGTATTTNYLNRTSAFYQASNGWELNDNVAGTDEIAIGVVGGTTTGNAFTELTIGSPQLAVRTKVVALGPGNFGSNPIYLFHSQGFHNANTAFDGIKFNFSGQCDGTINVYGLRD